MLSFRFEGEQEGGRKWERRKANGELGALGRGETEGQLVLQEMVAWKLNLLNS